MQQHNHRYHTAEKGFSLIELIAVMVIVGIIATIGVSRLTPSTMLQLQAGRDLLTTALFSAQQKAMAQLAPVRVIVSGSTVDVRVDSNRDGNFTADESISVAGIRYPLDVSGGITFSSHVLNYDHLGHTSPTVIAVSNNGQSVDVTVTATGYAY
ncbi:type II secretion system protein [Saccharophagus sp. K07]|uniref:prepilin-type N-terminal cleavage/methylation domain-containing protein n=1 Tax=Saccharophagus sp. K07 TaxID=2283636 RepID=UPI0016520C9E